MLTKMIIEKEKQENTFKETQLKRHYEKLTQARRVKSELKRLSEGKLHFIIRNTEPTEENLRNYTFPDVQITNLQGCITISNGFFNEKGDLVEVGVSSLGIFPLMGTKITIREFFRKIAYSYNF